MAIKTQTNKCKVVLKYEKGSSNYSVSATADQQVIFDTALAINTLQKTRATGVFKSVEDELISI
jgi:hypothetical protein